MTLIATYLLKVLLKYKKTEQFKTFTNWNKYISQRHTEETGVKKIVLPPSVAPELTIFSWKRKPFCFLFCFLLTQKMTSPEEKWCHLTFAGRASAAQT